MNIQNLRIAAHTIKGSCANLSLKKVSKAAEVLEKSSRARNESKIDDEHYIPIFYEFFEKLLTEIDCSFQGISKFVTDYDKAPLDKAIRDGKAILPNNNSPDVVNPPPEPEASPIHNEPEKTKIESKPEIKPEQQTAKVAPNDNNNNNTQQQQQSEKEGCCIIIQV